MISSGRSHKIRKHFELEDVLLDEIKRGYEIDPITEKLTSAVAGIPNIQHKHGFWFVDNRLIIPNAHGI